MKKKKLYHHTALYIAGGALALSQNLFADITPATLPEAALLQQSLQSMVFVQGGTFTMGQVIYQGQPTNFYTPHQVTLSSYYMSKDNVSYGEYDAYTQATGQPDVDPALKKYHFFARDADHPVFDINWYQADQYCAWLAKKISLPYALPTEAQWEYAARDRGNPNWAFPTDNGGQDLGKNFPSFQQVTSQPGDTGGIPNALPVGSIPCTPMGICGMAGEVGEWVNDWYQHDYNPGPVTNPQGPSTGTEKIIRGGGSDGDPEFNNSIGRAGRDPNSATAGFRCVVNTASLPPK